MESAPENPKLSASSGHTESDSGASADPNPTRLGGQIDLDEVEGHRRLICEGYDRCLEIAARSGWPSWSCENCRMFAKDTASQKMSLDHEAAGRPGAGL